VTPEAGLPNVYEGPEVLSALLARAGSPHDTREVAERFRSALAAGQERSDVIPTLFTHEPRFASPEEARRLYGNLFALWSRIGKGLSVMDDLPAAVEEPPAPPARKLPPRGTARGTQLSALLVDDVWKHLDTLSDRERQRLLDRFEAAQPNVVAWLDAIPLVEEGVAAAHDLAFETWAMFDVAFGDRVGEVSFQTLRATQAEPAPLDATQPALAAYVAEALDILAEEDAQFGATARAQVERAVAVVAGALCDVLAGEDDA
jgi:hypothetical protein